MFLNIGWTWLLYPFVFLATGLFAAGLGYCLAVANVYFRDTGQIFGIVLQLWFFLTPIMYAVEMIPAEAHGVPLRAVLAINPMTEFVEIARALLYDLTLPPVWTVLYAGGWTLALLMLAVFVHRRFGQDISEAI